MSPTPRPTSRQRERQKREEVLAAVGFYASARGGVEHYQGMRNQMKMGSPEERDANRREMICWRQLDESGKAMRRALSAYARAIRASAKENAK